MTFRLLKKSLFNLGFHNYKRTPKLKAFFTEKLFTEIAPVYNFILEALSLFQDKRWKRYLVTRLLELPQGLIIDLATGTGKIAFHLAKKYPERNIHGIDICEPMLDVARTNNTYSHVSFKRVNIAEMDYPDNSVALFTGGYALRNAPDLDHLLSSIFRQLKSQGMAAFLDFSKPANGFYQKLHFIVLSIWCTFWSLVLHRNRNIYNYIPQSLTHYPNCKELEELFTKIGFKIKHKRFFLLGMTQVIIVQKP